MDGVQELIRLDAVLGRWIHCGQLILRKISKLVATRCQILSLKCTKFDFHCSSVSIPEPMGGGGLQNSTDPLVFYRGILLRGGEGTEGTLHPAVEEGRERTGAWVGSSRNFFQFKAGDAHPMYISYLLVS